jgi:hypothetical protein
MQDTGCRMQDLLYSLILSCGTLESCIRFSAAGQNMLQQWEHMGNSSGTDDKIPQRFTFFPSGCIRQVAEAARPGLLRCCRMQNGSPTIEIPVCRPIPCLELLDAHSGRTEHAVTGVVQIPILMQDSSLTDHASVKPCAGVWSQDVERGGLNSPT